MLFQGAFKKNSSRNNIQSCFTFTRTKMVTQQLFDSLLIMSVSPLIPITCFTHSLFTSP